MKIKSYVIIMAFLILLICGVAVGGNSIWNKHGDGSWAVYTTSVCVDGKAFAVVANHEGITMSPIFDDGVSSWKFYQRDCE